MPTATSRASVQLKAITAVLNHETYHVMLIATLGTAIDATRS